MNQKTKATGDVAIADLFGGWVKCADRLPPEETPVLIVVGGKLRIGELRWERPTWEETWQAFQYWDDPEDDGREWDWEDVTEWTPLPSLPNAQSEATPPEPR